MKSFIALFALVAVAAADVSHLTRGGAESDAQVIRADSDVRPDGFEYLLETSNDISAKASGVVKPHGEELALNVQGSNHYTGPDGNSYDITYIANENGYQPQGAHLPTPPPTQPIPDYILRSIEYNAAHEASQVKSPAQYNQKFNRF